MLDMNHDNKIDSRDHYLFDQAAGDNEKKTSKRYSIKLSGNKIWRDKSCSVNPLFRELHLSFSVFY